MGSIGEEDPVTVDTVGWAATRAAEAARDGRRWSRRRLAVEVVRVSVAAVESATVGTAGCAAARMRAECAAGGEARGGGAVWGRRRSGEAGGDGARTGWMLAMMARRGESEGAAMMADAVSVDGDDGGRGARWEVGWGGARWEVREVVGSEAVDNSRPLDLMNEYVGVRMSW